MDICRRDFLRLGAVGCLATIGWSQTRSQPIPEEVQALDPVASMPIVDTHQHLWDLTRFRLPWLRPGEELNRSFLPVDYQKAVAGLNITQAVYMEVDVDPSQLSAEAEYVIELCKAGDTATVAAVIGGRPAADDFKGYLARVKDSPYIKGVRHIVPIVDGRAPLYRDDRFEAGMRLLGEWGMSFDLCVPPTALPDAIQLVEHCSETRFILDHCGNADPNAFKADDASEKSRTHREQWRRDIGRLAERKHVVCKISGIVAQMRKGLWAPEDLAPVVNHCLDSFGPDRVMFASDWPVCTRGAALKEWVEALRTIVRDRDETQRRKLFHDNAVAFYRLDALNQRS